MAEGIEGIIAAEHTEEVGQGREELPVFPSMIDAGTASFGTDLRAWAGPALGSLSFVVYAALAFVFPSGSLPPGPAGRRILGLLVAATAICLLPAFLVSKQPFQVDVETEILIRNPFAIAPLLDPFGDTLLPLIVTLVPIAKYAHFNLRVCRPVGIPLEQRYAVIDYALDRIGRAYDSQQIVDLARYLFPYPPVPVWFRRRMLAIGAGDPTKAICSALIAEAFASIRYPILPERLNYKGRVIGVAPFVEREILHIRKSGLYAPRDFDVSPYFQIVKPGLDDGFDFTTLRWAPADQTSALPLSP